MSDKTREKNVTTTVCNVYRTYTTSKMHRYWYRLIVGSGLMCSEEMIGEWSESEIGENVRVGDKVELADVMTRSSVCECRCVGNETC